MTDIVSTVVGGYLTQGKKIQAIKEVRSETGFGLRESKELVEGYMDGSRPYTITHRANVARYSDPNITSQAITSSNNIYPNTTYTAQPTSVPTKTYSVQLDGDKTDEAVCVNMKIEDGALFFYSSDGVELVYAPGYWKSAVLQHG